MTQALAYLLWHSWKNRLVMRVRRLKQPKYLFGAIVGGLYFFFYFFRFLGPGMFGHKHAPILAPDKAAWLEPLGALILFLALIMAWVLPRDRAALVFSEAEVAFLFPAPVKRRTLIHFKLVKSQLRILMLVLFLTIAFGRFLSGGIAWMHALSWWVILSTLNLHNLGASFSLTMLLDKGISNWKRRVAILTVVAAIVAGVAMWAHRTIPPPDLQNMRNISDAQYYLEHTLQEGPAFYLLYPCRSLVRPYLQTSLIDFLEALLPALAIMWLHYLWVLNSNVAFEESSIEASKKMAERLASIRANRGQLRKATKKTRTPFKLRPNGLPAVGFLWKSLIAAGQLFNLRLGIFVLIMALIFGSNLTLHQSAATPWLGIAGMLSFMILVMSFLIGPQLVRQDFRQDLPMADIIKTYPLTGWQVALGELFAPAAILTFVQWLMVVICFNVFTQFGPAKLDPQWRTGVALGVTIIAPGLNFLLLIVPNAAVLLFPAWFQSSRSGPQGIEAMGQRLIFFAGQLLVLVVALAPAALVFAVAFYLVNLSKDVVSVALPVGALGAEIVLLAEAALGILWLGKLFERFDVAGDGANLN